MNGYLHGTQEYKNKDFSMVLYTYVHCSAHSSNLALKNTNLLSSIQNCIETI